MKKKPYDYSCLMLDLNIKDWDKLLDKIDDSLVYNNESNEYGKETEPHVTILYGLHQGKEILNQLRDICSHCKSPIEIKVNRISIFETEDFDVLKFDVESEILTKLNKIIATSFENTNDYPGYLPHITISYLKKGTVKKDLLLELNDYILKSNKFTFSLAKTTNKVNFNNSKIENVLKGGKGDFSFIDDFELDSILDGLKVESEHTNNKAERLEIVLDHLTEDIEYYKKLKSAGLADEL